jgi:hypothetical protein
MQVAMVEVNRLITGQIALGLIKQGKSLYYVVRDETKKNSYANDKAI